MTSSDRVPAARTRRALFAGAAVLAVVLSPLAAGVAPPAGATGSTVAQVRVTTSWSASQVVVGDRVRASGNARPAGAVRRVVLQRRMPDGWQRVKSVDPATSSYSLRVPTGWYGRFVYRVKAVGPSGTPPAYSPTQRIQVVPAYDPRGSASSHALMTSPVARWNPCRVIGYRLNTDQAAAGAARDVRGALHRVHQATGLRFAYRGTTEAIPQGVVNSYPRDTALVIAWARPGQSALLGTAAGSPMAVGGAAWTYGFHNADGSEASQIHSGHVVVDATQQSRTPAGFGRGRTRGELLMHELGHALGLRHVDDPRQLMYPLMQSTRARWGAGDLAGLELLGANRGCLS